MGSCFSSEWEYTPNLTGGYYYAPPQYNQQRYVQQQYTYAQPQAYMYTQPQEYFYADHTYTPSQPRHMRPAAGPPAKPIRRIRRHLSTASDTIPSVSTVATPSDCFFNPGGSHLNPCPYDPNTPPRITG